jgi:periodic tryptophan protein 1
MLRADTEAMGAFANVKGLTYYRDQNDDPFITLKEDDEEIEREELALLATDNMLVTARTSDDLSGLDFHVYDEANESLYTHHDLILPTFPLCLEWLDFNSGPSDDEKHGQLYRCGPFDPSIEIWDCDVVDGLYPHASRPAHRHREARGQALGTGKKKRRQMVQPTANADYHVQPVLTLSWTPKFRNLLLSGSADATVKLWDLTRESPMSASQSWDNIHLGEVQAVEWNKAQAGAGTDSAVLSGGYDRVVKVWDAQTKSGEGFGVKVTEDIECAVGPVVAYLVLRVARERPRAGVRRAGALVEQERAGKVQRSDGAASALDINPHQRVHPHRRHGQDSQGVERGRRGDGGRPGGRRYQPRDLARLGLGKVFAARWCPDLEAPLTIAAAGSKASCRSGTSRPTRRTEGVWRPPQKARPRACRDQEERRVVANNGG